MSMGIADVYTSSVRDDDAAIALIHRALDLGITLLDTADIYGVSELQVGKALRDRRALPYGRRAPHPEAGAYALIVIPRTDARRASRARSGSGCA